MLTIVLDITHDIREIHYTNSYIIDYSQRIENAKTAIPMPCRAILHTRVALEDKERTFKVF